MNNFSKPACRSRRNVKLGRRLAHDSAALLASQRRAFSIRIKPPEEVAQPFCDHQRLYTWF